MKISRKYREREQKVRMSSAIRWSVVDDDGAGVELVRELAVTGSSSRGSGWSASAASGCPGCPGHRSRRRRSAPPSAASTTQNWIESRNAPRPGPPGRGEFAGLLVEHHREARLPQQQDDQCGQRPTCLCLLVAPPVGRGDGPEALPQMVGEAIFMILSGPVKACAGSTTGRSGCPRLLYSRDRRGSSAAGRRQACDAQHAGQASGHPAHRPWEAHRETGAAGALAHLGCCPQQAGDDVRDDVEPQPGCRPAHTWVVKKGSNTRP